MYIFHDSALNIWRFHPGELPEKPNVIGLHHAIQGAKYLEYERALAAIRENALTVQNQEICPQNISAVEPDKFYEWAGGYETKETLSDGWVPSYNDPDNSGLHPPAEPITRCHTHPT